MKQNLPDQDQIESESANLTLRCRDLCARLQAAGKTPPAEPAYTDDILMRNARLKLHLAAIESMTGVPKPATTAPTTPAPAATKHRPMTSTERILAAKGCKTIEELNAKHASGILKR